MPVPKTQCCIGISAVHYWASSHNQHFADSFHPVQHRRHPRVYLQSFRQRTYLASNSRLQQSACTVVVACCCVSRLKRLKYAKVQLLLRRVSRDPWMAGGHDFAAHSAEPFEQSASCFSPAEPSDQPAGYVLPAESLHQSAACAYPEQLHGWLWTGQLVCHTTSAIAIHHAYAW